MMGGYWREDLADIEHAEDMAEAGSAAAPRVYGATLDEGEYWGGHLSSPRAKGALRKALHASTIPDPAPSPNLYTTHSSNYSSRSSLALPPRTCQHGSREGSGHSDTTNEAGLPPPRIDVSTTGLQSCRVAGGGAAVGAGSEGEADGTEGIVHAVSVTRAARESTTNADQGEAQGLTPPELSGWEKVGAAFRSGLVGRTDISVDKDSEDESTYDRSSLLYLRRTKAMRRGRLLMTRRQLRRWVVSGGGNVKMTDMAYFTALSVSVLDAWATLVQRRRLDMEEVHHDTSDSKDKNDEMLVHASAGAEVDLIDSRKASMRTRISLLGTNTVSALRTFVSHWIAAPAGSFDSPLGKGFQHHGVASLRLFFGEWRAAADLAAQEVIHETQQETLERMSQALYDVESSLVMSLAFAKTLARRTAQVHTANSVDLARGVCRDDIQALPKVEFSSRKSAAKSSAAETTGRVAIECEAPTGANAVVSSVGISAPMLATVQTPRGVVLQSPGSVIVGGGQGTSGDQDGPLPDGWKSRMSKKWHKRFYFSSATGQTQWSRPVAVGGESTQGDRPGVSEDDDTWSIHTPSVISSVASNHGGKSPEFVAHASNGQEDAASGTTSGRVGGDWGVGVATSGASPSPAGVADLLTRTSLVDEFMKLLKESEFGSEPVTHIRRVTALRLLRRCSWNVDTAVNIAFAVLKGQSTTSAVDAFVDSVLMKIASSAADDSVSPWPEHEAIDAVPAAGDSGDCANVRDCQGIPGAHNSLETTSTVERPGSVDTPSSVPVISVVAHTETQSPTNMASDSGTESLPGLAREARRSEEKLTQQQREQWRQELQHQIHLHESKSQQGNTGNPSLQSLQRPKISAIGNIRETSGLSQETIRQAPPPASPPPLTPRATQQLRIRHSPPPGGPPPLSPREIALLMSERSRQAGPPKTSLPLPPQPRLSILRNPFCLEELQTLPQTPFATTRLPEGAPESPAPANAEPRPMSENAPRQRPYSDAALMTPPAFPPPPPPTSIRIPPPFPPPPPPTKGNATEDRGRAASKQSITGGADVHHCNGDRLEQISVSGNIDSTREAPDAEEPKAQKAMNNADEFRAGDTPLEVERRRHAFRQQTMFNEALLHADESGNIDLDGLRAAMRKVAKNVTEHEVIAHFQAMDVDNDGKISVEESATKTLLQLFYSHVGSSGAMSLTCHVFRYARTDVLRGMAGLVCCIVGLVCLPMQLTPLHVSLVNTGYFPPDRPTPQSPLDAQNEQWGQSVEKSNETK